MKKIIYLLVLLLSLTIFKTAVAQEKTCAQVTFFNQEILCLKKGLGVISPKERASLIEKRLDNLSNDLSLNPEDITKVAENGILNVNLNDYYIMSLSDGDFDFPASETFDVASGRIVNNIKKALIDMRKAKGPETLIKGAIYTGIATFVLIVVFVIFSKVFPRLYLVIEDKGKRIPSLKIQNWEVLNSTRVVQFILWLAHVARTLLTLLALYIYIPLVLSFFPVTAPMAPYIFSFIANPLKSIFQALVDFIPNFFIILVIGFVTAYVLKLIRFFFDEIERGNIEFTGFYKDWAMPSYMLLRGLVIAFSLVVIFPYIPGSDSSAFKGVSVFFGILLSVGSSSSIANIVAGVVITYMRPFKIGDVVKVNDTMGKVTEKNLLVTRIKSNKNVDITVPNSMILGSHIFNFSNNAQTDGLILTAQVTFGYEVPWQKIHKILNEAALKTPSVLNSPAPFVWHKSLDDNYVTYELNIYTNNAQGMGQINSDLNQNIQDLFHQNGIELVSPFYTALRDGSETTLPKENREAGYEVPKLFFK